DGAERTYLLSHQHWIPERQQEEAACRRRAPLGQQPSEDGHVLVVRSRRCVVIAHEERVQTGATGGGRPLDHPAGAQPGGGHVVAAGQRDADSHGSSYRFPEYFRSHPFVKDLPRCGVFAMVDALKKSPNSAENWYKLGVALGQTQRRSDAIGAYREAIRLKR